MEQTGTTRNRVKLLLHKGCSHFGAYQKNATIRINTPIPPLPMALQHNDIKIGDRVYSPHHSQIFLVEDINPEYLLLKPANPQNPRRLVEPVDGLHWGLESFESYKEIAKLTDQLNSYPQSHWR